jgi:TolA-binding protein
MPCDQIAAEGVAERYLLGQLGEEEQAALERHYFDCERCFGELQTLEAMQAELRQNAATSVRAARRAWRPARVGAAAAVVLATGVGFWVMRPAQETRSTPPNSAAGPVAVSPPPVGEAPAPTPPVQTPAVSVGELARFEPPPYVPAVLRGPEDEARRLFQAAMAHYVRGDHAQAIDGLRRAAGMDPAAADASFFLGVCLLLAGQPKAGVTELGRTIALGDSPYVEEAHFYRAKGLLQMGDVSAASRELRAMIALGGDHQREAKQLLGQVERVRTGR